MECHKIGEISMNNQNFIETKYNIPFIPNRADPHVYLDENGTYYFTASVPEYDRIVIRKAKTLMDLRDVNEVTVWKKHDEGKMSIHIWAPELHYIDKKWYLYFAAGDKDNIWAIRPYVLECKDQDPTVGEWRELGQMQGADDYTFQDFSLDMTVFQYQKEWYCIWAEKVSVGKKISNLYIAKMKTPWKLATQQVLLSSPVYAWERKDFWVNEGPSVIYHKDKLYLTFSASATGSCYCIGLLSIKKGMDLLDPSNWSKENSPVFKTDIQKGIYGPGHNCFTKLLDKNVDLMVYHARQYDEILGDPLYDPNRHTYLASVSWMKEKPVFSPLDWKELQNKPVQQFL